MSEGLCKCGNWAVTNGLCEACIKKLGEAMLPNEADLAKTEEKCGNCRFWKNVDGFKINKDDVYGSCFRYPARVGKLGNEWCGEFEVKKDLKK